MTAGSPERRIIVGILMDMDRGTFMSEAIASGVRCAPADINRSFITREVKGVTERRITIDYIIDSVARTKTSRQDSMIRSVLRMAVYELVFEDGIPQHAAVNEAVELVKRSKHRELSGFVNGVLRNINRNRDGFTSSFYKKTEIIYSIPKWIFERWKIEFGFNEAENMAKASLAERKLTARVNTRLTDMVALTEMLDSSGTEVVPLSENKNAFVLSGVSDLTSLSAFREGFFYVSDLSSQAVVDSAGIKPGDEILDICAAPGGKSVTAAILTGDKGKVVSCDLTPRKVLLIEENIKRLKLTNVEALLNDAKVLKNDFIERFDIVLADLPCSGLGTIAHKPDVKYRVKESDIAGLAAAQREILGTAARYVKMGGRLVFSTCTVDLTENRKNAEWFLESHPDYELIASEQRFITESYDGFFYAVFRKRDL